MCARVHCTYALCECNVCVLYAVRPCGVTISSCYLRASSSFLYSEITFAVIICQETASVWLILNGAVLLVLSLTRQGALNAVCAALLEELQLDK